MFTTPGVLNLLPRLTSIRRMAANRFSAESAAKSPSVRVDCAKEDNRQSRDPNHNPLVASFRQLMSRDSTDGWEKCWEEGLTPWDLGQTTPIISHLIQTGKLPEGRILVPGCGMGYDVVAMASPERFVVGLDISSTAINKAIEWSSSLPNARYFTFLTEDFFSWTPREHFDVIFDYTFFCAIHPSLRSAWASKEVGPPYNTSVADYVEVLIPVGLKAISIVDNELAVKQRKGAEKLGRWKKSLIQSSI